jgi:fatty acid synthase subunit beta
VEKLRGRYVPNLTAKLFDVSRDYLEDVRRLTGSEVIGGILERWDELDKWEPEVGVRPVVHFDFEA